MLTQTNNSRVTAWSSRLSAVELYQVANHICRERDTDQWSLFGIDNRGMVGEEVNDVDHVFWYFPARLTSLRHFRLHCNKDQTRDVSVNRRSKFHPKCTAAIADWFRMFVCEQIRHMGVTFFVNESGESCDDIYGEFSIQLNARFDGGHSSYSIHVGQFAKTISKERRIRFLGRAISLLGLDDILQIVLLEDAFRVDARPPWKVDISGADLQRRNPWLFRFELLGSFDDAWSRVERLLSDAMIKRIDNISVGMTMASDQYELLHHKLNEIATGWKVNLYGSYADGIDPYASDASQSPDGRFPIFTWMPARECQGIFYQVDIVPTPSGRVLEIHSNCGNMPQLISEAESATGVRFTPIDHETVR